MKQPLLIFLFSLFILFVGVLYGFGQIYTSFEVPEETRELSTPIEGEVDKDYLESLRPGSEVQEF